MSGCPEHAKQRGYCCKGQIPKQAEFQLKLGFQILMDLMIRIGTRSMLLSLSASLPHCFVRLTSSLLFLIREIKNGTKCSPNIF